MDIKLVLGVRTCSLFFSLEEKKKNPNKKGRDQAMEKDKSPFRVVTVSPFNYVYELGQCLIQHLGFPELCAVMYGNKHSPSAAFSKDNKEIVFGFDYVTSVLTIHFRSRERGRGTVKLIPEITKQWKLVVTYNERTVNGLEEAIDMDEKAKLCVEIPNNEKTDAENLSDRLWNFAGEYALYMR